MFINYEQIVLFQGAVGPRGPAGHNGEAGRSGPQVSYDITMKILCIARFEATSLVLYTIAFSTYQSVLINLMITPIRTLE